MKHRYAMIGARADGRIAIAGTRTIACEECGAATLFAPSSLTRPEASDATFVCLPCAAELAAKHEADGHPPIEVAPITEAQIAELRKASGR